MECISESLCPTCVRLVSRPPYHGGHSKYGSAIVQTTNVQSTTSSNKHPSSQAATFECTLSIVNLESDAKYQGLSYTWGDPFFHHWYEKPDPPAQEVPIICNGVKIGMTSNPDAALKRRSHGTRKHDLRMQRQSLAFAFVLGAFLGSLHSYKPRAPKLILLVRGWNNPRLPI